MARTSEWFNGLSKKAQAEYLKAHPNSKFGKGTKTASNSKQDATRAKVKSSVADNAAKTARKAPATVGGGSSRMKAIAKITALSAQLKELRSKQSAVKQGSVAYKRLESEMNAIKKQRLQLKAKHM